ncbi:MAG: hypothetical protein GVY04_12855 [Cyanobacteria bacterium]|jgi:hypothetical protein|nr:hypothetical protein [Cyanobacteria bacterium GSL.Bin1]
MFQRTLTLTLISSLLIGTTGLFASRANAQSVDVPFEVTVPEDCTITGNNGPYSLTASSGVLTGDTSGNDLIVNCNTTTAQLTLSAPVEGTVATSITSVSNLTSTASLTGGAPAQANLASDGTANTTLYNPATIGQDITVQVGMTADFATDGSYSEVPAGSYNYTVDVTLTP